MLENNKYLIVGLGNIGPNYIGTRHNIGFDVLETLANKINITFKLIGKCKAMVAKYNIDDKNIYFAMPQTYMNLSGDAVLPLLKYFDIPLENLIVVYDDIYLDVGRIRIRENGSAGGHNGMKSIIAKLKSQDFIRIRVGVSNKPENMDLATYVLSKFKKEEYAKVDEAVIKSIDAINEIIKNGCKFAMNKFN